MSVMAFGHRWDNEERLRKVCADVATLAEKPEWKSLELLCKLTIELKREQFATMKDILDVREAAGVIEGLKKALAFPSDCGQVQHRGS